jgi:hypothetical protein
MILRGVKADQPHCSLRIFERHRGFRFYLTASIPMHPRVRNAVLQEHTRDPLRRQPVTDLRAFEIDRQDVIATARKYDYRSANILPFCE